MGLILLGQKKLKLKNDKKVVNLTLNKEYKISGVIYTVDGKTPNPGISIELINIKNNKVKWITILR